ncbi:hypothetical protein CDD81_2446 [Ophiocordyceps australis]|uniref:Uncharacterized protein n=1 Tax=Ophiocordyceps australis TaxID=1399860 RepID=A0A2C5X7K5_9HYPO|nr:hypothetical protein CDD81_2446 [Ophiocordyceps australis]
MSQDAMSLHRSSGPSLGPSRRLAHLVSKFEILDAMSSVESELRALAPGPTTTTTTTSTRGASSFKTRRAVVSPCSTTPSALSRSSTAKRSRMAAADGRALSPSVSENMSVSGARPRSMVAERRKLFESDAANKTTNSIVMNRRSQFESPSNSNSRLALGSSWHSWTPSPPRTVLKEDSSSLNKSNNQSSSLATARTCPSLVSRFSSPDGDRVPISPNVAIMDRIPLCSPGYQARRGSRRDSIGATQKGSRQASPCKERPFTMYATPAKLQTEAARSKTPLTVSTGNLTYCTAPSTGTVRVVGDSRGCGVEAANTKTDTVTKLRKSSTHTRVGAPPCSSHVLTHPVQESRYRRSDLKISAQHTEPKIVEIELPLSSTCFVAQPQRGTIYSQGEQVIFDHDDGGNASGANAAWARDQANARLVDRIGLYESLSRSQDLGEAVPCISAEPMSRRASVQDDHVDDFEPRRRMSGFESKLRQLSGSWSRTRLARAMARQPVIGHKTGDDAAKTTATTATTSTTTTTTTMPRRRRFTPAFTSEASSSVYDEGSVTRLVGRRRGKRKSLSVDVYEAPRRPKSPAFVLPWHKSARRAHACYASVDDGDDYDDDEAVVYDGGRGRRRAVSRSSGTLVAQVHCSLDQPQPVRAREVNRLVSMCLEKVKATGRKGRGQSE